MMKYNDLDMRQWQHLDIDVNSLWLIDGRDRSGKHKNVYHGNFIPQIPNQLIRRYTKENETVLDIFMGSGTTLFECEKLERNFIGFDINTDIVNYVENKMQCTNSHFFAINQCDVTNSYYFDIAMAKSLKSIKVNSVQFLIMHPPYMDVVKFTDKPEDLSQIGDLNTFVKTFNRAISNAIKYLDVNRYFAVVIGDVYKNREIIPLAFYVMDNIKRSFKVKLKGIVVKNIEGNRGKLGKNGIWTYRALNSDYYIFKHEYILIFKKEY